MSQDLTLYMGCLTLYMRQVVSLRLFLTVRFIPARTTMYNMTPREHELLQGMGNCYAACHASFEETVDMVGGSRGLSSEEVKSILALIREKYGQDAEYRTLRTRLPDDFPM